MSGIRRLGPGGGTAAVEPGRAGRAGGGGGFRLPEGGGGGAASGTAAAAPLSAPAGLGLLSLQAEPEDAAAGRNARARRRGEKLLEELRRLQAEMLRPGGASPDRLARLAALAEGEAAADPALQDILAGIALRARVELARAGLAPSVSSN